MNNTGMDIDSKQQDQTGSTGQGQDLSRRQGLIAVNDLTYVLEPDLSVASNKTHKKHFFQTNTYKQGQLEEEEDRKMMPARPPRVEAQGRLPLPRGHPNWLEWFDEECRYR